MEAPGNEGAVPTTVDTAPYWYLSGTNTTLVWYIRNYLSGTFWP